MLIEDPMIINFQLKFLPLLPHPTANRDTRVLPLKMNLLYCYFLVCMYANLTDFEIYHMSVSETNGNYL